MAEQAINIFERATRLKARFASPQGQLSVEDLWDLPLTSATGKANLNDIAVRLHNQIKDAGEVSFVPTAATKLSVGQKLQQLMLDVVKHVIAIKLADAEEVARARAKQEEKGRLLEALSAAEAREVGAKSSAEIRAMIEAL
jgi:hypothetical protein